MTYKVVILCSQKIYNLGARSIRDKNSCDTDGQWIRKNQKGQLQNIETAKTEVHKDLESKTMADLRCAKEEGVRTCSALNALIWNLNSSPRPGGQKAKSRTSLVSVSVSLKCCQTHSFTDYLWLLSHYRATEFWETDSQMKSWIITNRRKLAGEDSTKNFFMGPGKEANQDPINSWCTVPGPQILSHRAYILCTLPWESQKTITFKWIFIADF